MNSRRGPIQTDPRNPQHRLLPTKLATMRRLSAFRAPIARPSLLLGLLLLAALASALHASGLFAPFLDGVPPAILRNLPSPGPGELPPDVRVRRLVFESIVVEEMTNEVFAVIAGPARPGPHPGLLLLHGGQGGAPEAEAILWAQRGYVALALDLPGIADPIRTTNSAGAWRYRPYNAMVWTVGPTPATSVLYDATAAALQGFELLRTQPGADRDRIGILGWSWGGYLTTQLSGLLGDRVAAAFSHYGSGFYEDTWFGVFLGWMQPADRALWLETFDAGRRAPSITAPFFMAAAANDIYFRPPAIEQTLAAIPGETGLVYAPNAHHQLPVPGGTNMRPGDFLAETWFARHLQGTGSDFPSIEWESTSLPGAVAFRVTGPRPPLAASLWYARPDPLGSWPDRRWIEVPANAREGGRYEVLLPPDAQTAGAAWFVLASDDRPVSTSTRMRITGRDLAPGYFLREGFSDHPPGKQPVGWEGSGVVRTEMGSEPLNRALALEGTTGTREASMPLASTQASPSGIEFSLRLLFPREPTDWSVRCTLFADQLGYSFVLSPGSAAIHRAGDATSLAAVNWPAGTISGQRWSGLRFQWRPGGHLELAVDGRVVAEEVDPLAPRDITFRGVSVASIGTVPAEGLLFDDLSVAPIAVPMSTLGPRLVSPGTAVYLADDDTTRTTLQFTGEANVLYGIEYSPVPAAGFWMPLGEHRADSGGRFQVALTLRGDFTTEWASASFFRVTRFNPPAGPAITR